MPAIHLATDTDMRAIDSRNLSDLERLPFLYLPTEDPDTMRAWGVARADGDAPVSWYAVRHPGALVAPHFAGELASRADLVYYGAEAAGLFVSPD